MALGYQYTSKSPKRNNFLNVAFIFMIFAIPSLCQPRRDLTIDQGVSGPVVLLGTSLNLTCRIDPSVQGFNSSHISWYQLLADGSQALLAEDTYYLVDNMTSVATVTNDQIGDHKYMCLLPGGSILFDAGRITVYVGIVPKIPKVECFNRNLLTFWCNFEESEPTEIARNFTMEFKSASLPESWTRCTNTTLNRDGSGACFVNEAENPGFTLKIKVRQSNKLGTSPPKVIIYDTFSELKPYPPKKLRVTNKSSHSIDLKWDYPAEWKSSASENNYMLHFRIRYTDVNHQGTPKNVTTTDLETTLSSLLPYSSYKIEAQCKCLICSANSKWSNWTDSMRINTLQDVPGAEVQELLVSGSETAAENAYKRTVSLVWKEVPVDLQNGEIVAYAVYFESDSGDSGMERTTTTSIHLENIDKFHEYTVRVTALTSVGEGPNATVTLEDLTTEPTSPEQAGVEVSMIARSNNSIEVKWEKPTMPSGYATAYELQWTSNNVDWSEIATVSGSQRNYLMRNLQLYTQYKVRLRIRNALGVSKWTTFGPQVTYGGAPSKVLLHEPKKVSSYLTDLEWDEPTQTYGEILRYLISYRPVVKDGQAAVAWLRASETTSLDARVRVNCSLVKGRAPFEVQVIAANDMGKSEPATRQLYMCDNLEVTTIIVSVLAVCFCVTLLLCCILCVRQSDITKPAPEPYFIDAVLKPAEASKFQWKDNRHSPKHEKESFDTLRSADSYTELLSPVIERMSSKDSSSASTDQGIHDMDVDSVDLKNGGPSSNGRRCNRYSSGMGQSIVSEGGHGTLRSNSNPGMEVLSEDYEDAVFEEVPQDIDDGSTPCLSHTYARSSMNGSPPLSPNEDEIGSSSSLLSNSSSGPTSLPPYSQMACNSHQRLSSSGSDTSGVNYHMMSSQGLAPINTSKESNDTGSVAYAKLSQIPTSHPTAAAADAADVAVDIDNAVASDEDAPEYHQMGLREPMLNKPNGSSDNQAAAQTNKSPSHFNIPSVHIGSVVQPPKEFIVATALMPNHLQRQQKQQVPEEKNHASGLDPCTEAKPCENEDVVVPIDDHSYSIVSSDATCQPVKPPNPPTSARPNLPCGNSSYVPNSCPNGFSIPNGTQTNCGVPSAPLDQGYVPNNSPPTQSVFLPPREQSPVVAHSPPRGNQGEMEGYAPATPQAMAAIVGGKPVTNQAYVPNTTVV